MIARQDRHCCIYCLRHIDSTTRPPSLEHIVQYALGGSNSFSTRRCCKFCNDRLGSTIDAPFLNQPPFSLLRLKHNLVGQSGRKPEFRFSGKATENGAPADLRFAHGSVTPRIRPVVERNAAGDDTYTHLAGESEDIRKILEGILRRAKTEGTIIRAEDGTVIETVDEALQLAESTPLREFQAALPFDLVALGLGLLKIAYGAAFLFEGDDWLSTKAAVDIRAMLNGPSSVTIDDVGVYLKPSDHHVTALALGPLHPENHVVARYSGGRDLLIALGLFGTEANHFIADLRISGEPAFDRRIGVVINPKDRSANWITVEEQLKLQGRMLGVPEGWLDDV